MERNRTEETKQSSHPHHAFYGKRKGERRGEKGDERTREGAREREQERERARESDWFKMKKIESWGINYLIGGSRSSLHARRNHGKGSTSLSRKSSGIKQ